MRPDVVQLQSFYTTPLGQVVPDLILNQMMSLLPLRPAGTVLGLGYVTPLLDRPAFNECRTLAAMPAAQGCMKWPAEGAGRVLMTQDHRLPFADGSVEVAVLLHCLEYAARPHRVLRELWRVLAPGGALLTVVPNRRRMWSALDVTPFGHGYPFSRAQLDALLRDHLLTPEATSAALFMPPMVKPWGARLVRAAESPFIRWMPEMGGVLVSMAVKNMQSTIGGGTLAVAPRAVLAGQDRPIQRDPAQTGPVPHANWPGGGTC